MWRIDGPLTQPTGRLDLGGLRFKSPHTAPYTVSLQVDFGEKKENRKFPGRSVSSDTYAAHQLPGIIKMTG